MAQPSIQGRFVWQELMTNDTAAAAAFYPKITGWQSSPSPHDASYTIFRAGTGPAAGLMKLPANQPGVPPHWLPYIGAENVDVTVAAAEKLGAKVLHAATEMAGVGRFAVLADPQGAAFGVYHPTNAMPEKPPSPGEFAWLELGTSNLEGAFEFYREVFGWQAINRMDMGAPGIYLIFGSGGTQRGGIHKLNPPGPARWLPYVEVPDADVAAAAARAAGARILHGPADVPGGRMVQLLDPSGVQIAVHSAAQAAKPAAPKKTPAAKAPAKPAAAPTSAAKPAVAKTAAAKVAPVKKSAAKKSPAKKTAAKKAKKAQKTASKKTAKRAKKSAKKSAKKKTVAKSARRPVAKKSAKKAKKTVRAKKKAARKK